MTCTRCAQEIPPGQYTCGHCQTPVEFSARDHERMTVDVRARILWGDPVETIREEWLKKGAPAADIEGALWASTKERNHHFRVRGLQDVGMALLAFLLGGGAGYLLYANVQGEIEVRGRIHSLILVAAVALPLAGLLLMFRGVRRLATGGAEEKAASDLSEFD